MPEGELRRLFFEHLKSGSVAEFREVSRDTMLENYHRQAWRGLASGTVRLNFDIVSSLRQFFAQLENLNAILLNPTVGVPLPKWERRLPRRILTRPKCANC